MPVQLPKQRIEVRESRPENVIISVDVAGGIYWYDARIEGIEALVARLKPLARQSPQPEVQIRGDANARYEGVGRVLTACQRAGIAKVSFITEPPPLGG